VRLAGKDDRARVLARSAVSLAVLALLLGGCGAAMADEGIGGQETVAPVQLLVVHSLPVQTLRPGFEASETMADWNYLRTMRVQTLRPGFEASEYSSRVECAVRDGGLQLTSWVPEVVAVTVNRSPWAGFCDVVVDFDLADRRDQTRARQRMRRTVWFEIGQEARLSFRLPDSFEVKNARVHTE
ncbi:MAG: hypothetical protein QME96_00260, partial [Myxococcota bacterium]|nr:hypothetical protein [Myxococcota bacterium]